MSNFGRLVLEISVYWYAFCIHEFGIKWFYETICVMYVLLCEHVAWKSVSVIRLYRHRGCCSSKLCRWENVSNNNHFRPKTISIRSIWCFIYCIWFNTTISMLIKDSINGFWNANSKSDIREETIFEFNRIKVIPWIPITP